MNAECSPSVRPLYAWEIREARRVFANQLTYERVRIHECNSLPDTINRIGTRLKGMEYTGAHNAITLGNHVYFPIRLLETLVPVGRLDFYLLPWLMHELTHVWQFQHMGWRYLGLALSAQFRLGGKAYEYGGEAGLVEANQKGWTLADFNLEQQGDIVSYYYTRLRREEDVSAWMPYINEIQQAT
jgi:hypothetical protein